MTDYDNEPIDNGLKYELSWATSPEKYHMANLLKVREISSTKYKSLQQVI